MGRVTAREGAEFAGQLVFDLDENRNVETLDGRANGVDLSILFEKIDSLALPGAYESGTAPATITLRSGEVLELEPSGDLTSDNAGLLVLNDDGAHYIPWRALRRIDFRSHPA